MGWKNDGREYVLGGKSTGRKMSWVEKRLEGIIVLGVKNDGREYNVWEVIFPYVLKTTAILM